MEKTELNKEVKSNFGAKIDIRKYSMVIILVVTWIILTLLTDGKFLTARNLSNLSRAMSVTAILATGMFMILVATHIDLSLGSLTGLCGAVAAILHVQHGWSTPTAIFAALFIGGMLGAWHGFWVAFKKVPAFIVTLGGLLVYRGIIMMITKGVTIAPLQKSFSFIGNAYIPFVWGWVLAVASIIAIIYRGINKRKSRLKYGFEINSLLKDSAMMALYCALVIAVISIMNMYEGIPLPVLIVAIISMLFIFITTKTRFGRQVFAMGGNVEAARLSGINVKARTMGIFILAGLLAAVAGVILTARLNAATTTAGANYELDAVASCVIGGTSLMGGEGHVSGAIIGALVMASLDNGMSLMNSASHWQYIVKGMILLLAVWIDIETKKKKA